MNDYIQYLFGDARPIDVLILLVDFLVLAVIVWIEVGEKWHKRKMNRRVTEVRPYFDRGTKLQKEVPNPFGENYEVAYFEWTRRVREWSDDTHRFLGTHSERAADSFFLIVNASASDSVVYPENWGGSFPLTGHHRESYQRLLSYLSNLRTIMEKPEAYF
jgi:hypothetical protein